MNGVPQKLLIAGTRTFTDYNFVRNMLDMAYPDDGPEEVISGGCRGTDLLGEKWAAEREIEVTKFMPDWNLHGEAAGPIRNRQMAWRCDSAFIFWNGKSSGTLNMIQELARNKKQFVVVGIP